MSRSGAPTSSLTNTIANPIVLMLLETRAAKVLGRRLAVVGYVGRSTGQPREPLLVP